MENNFQLARKIPLEQLMDILEDLYSKGLDYVDIMGKQGDLLDEIYIMFQKDYMSEEVGQDKFDEIFPITQPPSSEAPDKQTPPPIPPIKGGNLNETNLNDLI